MAHIQYGPDGNGGLRLIVNGVDLSMETLRGVELVSVGDGDDDPFAMVGFRLTLAVSRLDLGNEQDVIVTDRLPEMAQRVRSMEREV